MPILLNANTMAMEPHVAINITRGLQSLFLLCISCTQAHLSKLVLQNIAFFLKRNIIFKAMYETVASVPES